jgi:hypothetical protein
MEENSRQHGDPWSLRQTGVYQQVNAEIQNSTWILLQLSRSTRSLLEAATIQSRFKNDNSISLMQLHCIMLSATTGNWGKYIKFLQSQLSDIVSLSFS